jgi:hypothetical protein
MNQQLNDILQKRMDRKDFLKHVGLGIAIITGTAGVIKLLRTEPKNVAQKQPASLALAYGGSAYGGNPLQKS